MVTLSKDNTVKSDDTGTNEGREGMGHAGTPEELGKPVCSCHTGTDRHPEGSSGGPQRSMERTGPCPGAHEQNSQLNEFLLCLSFLFS